MISELKTKVGSEVTVSVKVETIRNQKHMVFLIGSDASGLLQMIVFRKSHASLADELQHLHTGSYVKVTGTVVEASQSKTDGLELHISGVQIASAAEPMPIDGESAIEKRFDLRVVDLKSEAGQRMLRTRSEFLRYSREFFYSSGFTELNSPKLMGSASESGSEVFKVEYFEQSAYLAQSPQFYKQMAIATGVDKVFEIGPIFRAEKSYSARHLTEFTGLDVEVSWAESVQEIMDVEEQMLQYAFTKMGFGPYKVLRISLAEAKEMLSKATGHTIGPKADLRDEDERMLYELTGVELIFVYDYPIEKRPFYHQYCVERGVTHSFDLIFKGIEITTGALREHRYDVLCKQAVDKKVGLESIGHYLDNFKYGCPPHGGFGLGVERVVQKLLDLASVKEASFAPRDPERLTP